MFIIVISEISIDSRKKLAVRQAELVCNDFDTKIPKLFSDHMDTLNNPVTINHLMRHSHEINQVPELSSYESNQNLIDQIDRIDQPNLYQLNDFNNNNNNVDMNQSSMAAASILDQHNLDQPTTATTMTTTAMEDFAPLLGDFDDLEIDIDQIVADIQPY